MDIRSTGNGRVIGNDRVKKLKTKISSSNLYELSYEQLLSDPEKKLREICDFLEEDFEGISFSFVTRNTLACRIQCRTDMRPSFFKGCQVMLQ